MPYYNPLNYGPCDPTPSMEDQFEPAEDMIDALRVRINDAEKRIHIVEQCLLAADGTSNLAGEPVVEPTEPAWEPMAVYLKRQEMVIFHLKKVQYWLQIMQTGSLNGQTIDSIRKMGL